MGVLEMIKERGRMGEGVRGEGSGGGGGGGTCDVSERNGYEIRVICHGEENILAAPVGTRTCALWTTSPAL